MNLNQVTLPAVDVDSATVFYQRLGLRLIVDSRPRYVRFECPVGEATLSVHRVDAPIATGGPVVYFEIEDLDATVASLRDQGVVFESGPADQPWLWREARLRDPAGNEICLYRAGDYRRYPPWRLSAVPED
jgi:catechol 2,3-dioxygenase-like lactoylglutathione lyase family enzyme